MRSTTIFSSQNVKEIYAAYNELSAAFLKQFKYHAEFGISHKTIEKDFCLNVYDLSAIEQKFLEDKILEFSQKKLKKPVD